MFATLPSSKEKIDENVDEYGHSYARDVEKEELRSVSNVVCNEYHCTEIVRFLIRCLPSSSTRSMRMSSGFS